MTAVAVTRIFYPVVILGRAIKCPSCPPTHSVISCDNKLHVLRTDPNQRFFKIPPPLTRNSSQGGVWQMLSPERDESCYVFGGEKITWVQGKQSFDGGATWMLWRPYDCCKKGKGSFLFSIETHGICI